MLARHDGDGRDDEVGSEAVDAIDEVVAEVVPFEIGSGRTRQDLEQLAGVPCVVHLIIVVGQTLIGDGIARTPGSVAGMGISELVGVYDADGGLRGEAAYVWDRMAADLPVPVGLLHLDELHATLDEVVAGTGAPVVLARDEAGWRAPVGAAELDRMAGSVGALEAVLRRHLAAEASA